MITGRIAIGLLLAALATGCDRGAAPATGRPPTPASGTARSSGASPTPVAPTPGSPADAARAYIAAYDAAAERADTSAYDRIVAPGCPCRVPFLPSFVASLRRHRWHTDARRAITSVRVVRSAGTGAIVDVAFRVVAYRVLDRHGRTVMPGEPDAGVLRLSLVRSDQQWIVTDAVRR